jgi:hypothetical protein
MATMTIAQALASSARRISVADTAADIAAVLPDPSLLARVSSFTLDADSTATVAQAEALLTLGALFRPGRYSYTIADSVAALSSPAAAAALTLASAITVVDTAANLLAGASSDTVLHANSTVLSSSTTVSAPQLLMLEALPNFTVATGQTITVADTLETLAILATPIAAAAAELPIVIQPTDSSVTLNADAAAALASLPGLRLAPYDVSVADTGAAITADASQLFDKGLTAITVTSGTFSGTPSQVADPTLQYAAAPAASLTGGDLIFTGGAQITTNTTLSTTQLLGDTLQLGFGVANGVTLTVQDTAENLIANAAVVETYATAIIVTDSPTLTAAQAEILAGVQSAVGAPHFSLGSNMVTVSDNPAALTNPANAGGIALAAGLTLPSDSVANAAQALTLAGYRGSFTTGGYNLVVIDTASALVALTGDIARAVNVWSGQVILSADATLSVASVEILQNLDGFGPGARHLTISDTVDNLLSPDSAGALAIATGTELSAPAANQTVATATALTALHGFTADTFALTVSDTPVNLAGMSAATAAFVTGVTFATRTVGNAADYTVSVAQLTALQALNGLSVRQFAGSFTVADTADTLTTLGSQLGSITIGSLLSKAMFALSVNTTTTATEAGNLANYPGFSTGGHSLAILDQPGALLSPGAIGGIALATSVGISAPATVSATSAASLAALHNYLRGSFPLTISDTPAALAAATQPALAIASAIQVSANTQQGGFTISVSQFNTMTGLTNLSFAGFSGTITVLDSATALVGLANSIATAGVGSVLKIASGAIVEQLSGNGTVNAAGLLALATLPPLSLNSHTLTVQDTPSALLTTFPTGAVPLATAVTLATNLSPWSVSAASAAALAAMPGFGVGTAGMAVLDTAANLVNPSYAAGIADAVSATLSGNATVTAANATSLYGLGNFSTGTASLTIQDGAGKLAALGVGAAALASSILQQGSGLVSVSQFTALRALPNFSTNGNLLIVADNATNLLTLASTNTSLATTLVLDANATSLTAAQAETLATLPNFTAGTAQLGIVDSGADLLHITGLGSLPDDWAGELAATSVTLSGNATMTASQADDMALLGAKFSRGSFTLTVADTAANLVLAANAAGVALGTTVTLTGNETALSAATATALAGIANFTKGVFAVTISDTSANLLDPAYAAGISLADHVKLSIAVALTVANAAALIGLANFQAGATLTIADTLPNLLALGSTTLAHNNSTLQSTAIGLSAATTATVAQLAALAALPQYTGFSRNGFALVLADTGAAIAGYTHDAIAVPTSYTMIGAATLTASQATVLAGDSIALNGNTLTVADTPTALLSVGNAAGVTLATALTLSAAASASATQATSLFAISKFSTGGYALTVSDSVSALLGLSNTVITAASSLALSATQSVSAAQLGNLSALGSKFSLAGHTLTVTDTAAALAALSSPALALANAETLSASATVSALVAAELAALPNFSKGSFVLTVSDIATNLLDPAYAAGLVLSGHATLSTSLTVPALEAAALALLPGFALGSSVTLTVQDSVANLIGLSTAAKAVATSELLPAGAVTVTAAQGAALDLLPHFSTSGATITVNDTVANLTTYTAWSGVDASYIVTDTAANIAAATPSTLIMNAASVVLAGGADITAATAATLAGIGTFSRGGWLLTVTDTPAAIATNATAILAVASSARIDAPTAITASQAEALVPLNTASKLGYSNGVTLSVQDSYTNLTNNAYTDGLALASTVTVFDTLANVLTATAHNWGSITPNYKLSGGGNITGAQATSLASLGARVALNGQTVVVADTALAVVTAAAALSTLNITAQVTDITAHVVAQVAGLIARGDRLTLVTLTDSTAITAAQADAMHNLSSVLAGNMLTVSDTAAVISFNVTNLLQFGSQLGSVYVTDTAANVESVTSGANAIQGLGALLHITLTDTNPVLAAIAAGLAPVVSYLAGGTSLAVTDTGAHIATYSSALTTLIGSLGTVTLSDGTTVSASVATGVAPIATHLGLGVKLSVVDTAAAIVAASTALQTMVGETRILSIVAANDLAANIVTYANGLEALDATATILDSSANVMTALDSLELLANIPVTAIAFTDLSAPVLTMSVNTLYTDRDAIALFTSSYGISVHDLAANIQADLASGSSTLVAHLSVVSSVVASDNGAISLTESRAVAAGVDSGVTSVMARFTGGAFTVTGVLASQVNTVAGLYVVPASMAVSDTASNIQTDLTSGSSALVAHRALISGITLTSGNTIMLTEAQATTAGVATLMNETTGLLHFNVTGVTIGQIATVAALGVTGTSMAVTPTVVAYLNDLTGGASVLEQYHAQIGSVVFSDSVNPNLNLTVAQITAADTILGLTGPNYTLVVADSATHIQNDLALGATSVILTHTVFGLQFTSGDTITLNEAQLVYSGVAAALHTLPDPYNLVVTGATIGQIATIEALSLGAVTITIDLLVSGAAVQADLTGGSSVLTAQAAHIGSITLSDMSAPTITLTVAQLTTDATVLGLIGSPYNLAVNDTALAVQTDLALGATSKILAHGNLSAITLPASSTITLTESQAVFAGVAAALNAATGLIAVDVTGVTVAQVATVAALGINNVAMAVSDLAAAVQGDLTGGSSVLEANESSIASIHLTNGGLPTITLAIAQITAGAQVLGLIASSYHLAVGDTAGNVQADLASGPSSVILGNTISGITLTSGHTITLTEAQAVYSGVAAALLLTTGLTSFVVTGATIDQITTVLALGVTGTTIGVNTSASAVQADLTGGSSVLTAQVAALQGITLADESRPTITLSVTQLGTDATVLGKIVSAYYIAVSDTATHVQNDLALGGTSNILAQIVNLHSIALTTGTTITLTEGQAVFAGVSTALGVTTGLTSFVVTAVAVNQVATVLNLGVTGTVLHVSDTAAHVQSDLTGGASVLEANHASISVIALTGGLTLTLSIAQITSASTVLSLISSYLIAVSDSATNIQNDLALGGSSQIVSHHTHVTSITLTSGNTITLTESQATASFVAGALSFTTGLTSFVVTNTLIAQVATVLALGITGTTIGIVDSAANVQSDLTGGSSVLTANVASLQSLTLNDLSTPTITLSVAQLGTDATVLALITPSSYHLVVNDTATNVQNDLALGATSAILAHSNLYEITLTAGATITLTESQAVYTGVAAALNLTVGLGSVHVTGVLVSQVVTVANLNINGVSIEVADSAADVQADLTGGSSVLFLDRSIIGSITLSDMATPTITLTIALITSDATVLSKIVSTYHQAIADTATHVQNDLALGGTSVILNHTISGITLTIGSTITLSESAAVFSGVNTALENTTGLTSFVVTGVAINQITTVLGLGVSNTTVNVSTTGALVQGDLTGAAVLVANEAHVGSITLTDMSTPTIALTVAQFESSTTVLGLIGSSYSLAISGLAQDVQNDLTGGTPPLEAFVSHITGITLTDGGTPTITMTVPQLVAAASVIPLLGPSYVLSVSGTAAQFQADLTSGSSVLVANYGTLASIGLTDVSTPTITLSAAQLGNAAALLVEIVPTTPSFHLVFSDTAANVQADLALGATSNILTVNAGGGNFTFDGGTIPASSTITLTESQAVYAGVATVLQETTGLAHFIVTGVTLAQIPTVSGLGVTGTSVNLSTSASALQSDLTGSQTLLADLAILSGITLTDMTTQTIAINVTQLTDNASVLALIGSPYHLSITDTANHVQTDLALGATSAILGNTHINAITLSPSGTITLTEAQAVYAGVAAALIETTGLNSFVVTGVAVSQVGTVAGLGVPNTTIDVSSTAILVQQDLNGATPVLVANLSKLGTITLTDGSTPTLDLSVLQLEAATGVLALIGSTYELALNGTASQVQTDLANEGTSAILAYASHVTGGLTLLGATTITLTESVAVYSGVAGALGLIGNLTGFTVTGVAINQITTVLGLGITPTTVSVSASAASVQSDLTGGSSVLTAHVADIAHIVLSDGSTPTITLNVTQAGADTAVLALISSTYHLAIGDTATAVQNDLATGGSSIILAAAHLTGVNLTVGTTITLTEAQAVFTGVAAVLQETSGLIHFVVTGVAINQIATVLALSVNGTTIHVSTLAATVQSDLTGGSSVLLADIAYISAITLTDGSTPTITLTVAQLAADATVLAAIGSSFHIAINDTAANVQNDLALGATSTILGNLSSITGITIPASSTITLTSAQLQYAGVDDSGTSAIAKTSGLSSLVATQALVADIGTVLGLQVPPTAIQVKDTDANITGDINGAGAIAAHLSVITTVTTNETTLGTTDATTIYVAVGSKFNESALTISDTAAALVSAHTAHAAMLTAALHLTLSANASGVSAANATTLAGLSNFSLNSHTLAVADSPTNLLAGGNATGILLATTVQLSAIATVTAQVATNLAALHAFTAGPAITVQDSVTNLVNSAYTTGLGIATTVGLAANDTASASQLVTLAGITGYTDGAFSLTLATNISGVLGLSQPQLGFATTTHITDNTSNFIGHTADIQAALPAHSHALSITLTDPVAESIFTSATNYLANEATYDAVTNANVIAVSDGAAAVAAVASDLAVNAAVGQVTVTDSAANILSNLTALNSIGSKFTSATVTDTSVNAAEVAALLTIPNLLAPGLTISDTGSQIAAAIQANAADLTFMNAHTVTLSGDSVIAASDAVILETLTSFSKAGYHLYVWDTASHLTDSVDGYLAAVQNGIISGVYLKATGNTATISASLASTLLSISAFNRNDPPSPAGDGLANTLIVSDTAAHIDAVYSSLNAHKTALSSIVVSATATVTDAVFGELLTLGATMAGGKTLTVRDTAANIIASAASQISGSPSITPTAWQISASASVAPSGAILLAGLTNFSIGAFTLTLTASATITVANANSLAGLTTHLALGGNHLFVNGTVATMTTGPGLSSNAKLIVTPNITDMFSNIATLTTGSGLLGGTITINDSEAITTTQASNFLALLGGSGIPVANVSFGSNVESITDTLSNITTLTSSGGWTGNTSVHSDFSLVVADTVSVLTNGSNTATLAGMHATTFSSNQTMLAATAETLFALENTIHFSKGSFTLTVQDTAANLLNPANSDGVALADTLNLSADGTVAAADAEALLTNSHFSVHGHTLTVSDSSADLLDGILAGDITGSGSNAANVVVELQAAEVLDAGTATALVALAGFTDPSQYLSIADGSSYLLAASAHTAEADATSVTLAGDETVSLATAKALSLLPNFSLQSNHLLLASNDFADAATLNAVASFGSGFNHNGFSITMTQDDLTLTPTQYTALQSDGVVLNGHALSAMPVSITVTSGAGTAHIAGTGVSGATLNVYSGSGSSLSTTSGVAASFTANASEGSIGNAMVVTETVGGSAATGESAPIIALEATVLTNAATADSATFAGTGAVQIGGGQYANLYTTATAPTNPANPILVYDPTAHTLSLNITGHAPTLLVTLGTATHPTALTAAEIFVQHFS